MLDIKQTQLDNMKMQKRILKKIKLRIVFSCLCPRRFLFALLFMFRLRLNIHWFVCVCSFNRTVLNYFNWIILVVMWSSCVWSCSYGDRAAAIESDGWKCHVLVFLINHKVTWGCWRLWADNCYLSNLIQSSTFSCKEEHSYYNCGCLDRLEYLQL